MSKPIPLDAPTRRGVEELFRTLSRLYDTPLQRKARDLSDRADAVREHLLRDTHYRRLEAAARKAHGEANHHRERVKEEAAGLRSLYLASGLTPDLQKKLLALVKKAHGR